LINEKQAQRLRLLGVAGLLAPALMALGGLALGLLPGGRLPGVARAPGWGGLGVGVAAAAASMLLVLLLSKSHPVFERALRRSGTKVGLDALETAGYPVMLVVVTAAAFGEEFLFRGGLQPLIGIVPAALLFGFSHGGWRREMWAYALAASLSGTVFGLVYQWTGNIWVPVSAHATHNVVSTLLMGKKVSVEWEGGLPRVRLLPEPPEEDEPAPIFEEPAADLQGPAPILKEAARDEEPAEPVSAASDSEATGSDDGNPADRQVE
jgi:membrane protease YdiL (CAAX protease family)